MNRRRLTIWISLRIPKARILPLNYQAFFDWKLITYAGSRTKLFSADKRRMCHSRCKIGQIKLLLQSLTTFSDLIQSKFYSYYTVKSWSSSWEIQPSRLGWLSSEVQEKSFVAFWHMSKLLVAASELRLRDIQTTPLLQINIHIAPSLHKVHSVAFIQSSLNLSHRQVVMRCSTSGLFMFGKHDLHFRWAWTQILISQSRSGDSSPTPFTTRCSKLRWRDSGQQHTLCAYINGSRQASDTSRLLNRNWTALPRERNVFAVFSLKRSTFYTPSNIRTLPL